MKNTNAKLKVQSSKLFTSDIEATEDGVFIALPSDVINHLKIKGKESKVHCIIVNGVLQISGEPACEMPVVFNPDAEFANMRL